MYFTDDQIFSAYKLLVDANAALGYLTESQCLDLFLDNDSKLGLDLIDSSDAKQLLFAVNRYAYQVSLVTE